eukprot:scaffold86519_cov63-Phaeocystis_antarctica.AAC.2
MAALHLRNDCAAAELASAPARVVWRPSFSSSSWAFSSSFASTPAASYSSSSVTTMAFSLSAAHTRVSMVSTVASESFLRSRPSSPSIRSTTPLAPPKAGRSPCICAQHASMRFARPAVVDSRQSPLGSSGRTPCASIAGIAVSADTRSWYDVGRGRDVRRKRKHLRCLVVQRASPPRRRVGHRAKVGGGREAKVGHPRHIFGAEQHVGRLEVEVDHLVRVHGLHAARDARE